MKKITKILAGALTAFTLVGTSLPALAWYEGDCSTVEAAPNCSEAVYYYSNVKHYGTYVTLNYYTITADSAAVYNKSAKVDTSNRKRVNLQCDLQIVSTHDYGLKSYHYY